MSVAQHIEWLNLVEKTGPFLAVEVLAEAFPQGLEKVETWRRQRLRSAYEEWREAVDSEDPQLDQLHQAWVRLVLEDLLEYDATVLKARADLGTTCEFKEPISGETLQADFAILAGDKPRILVGVYPPDLSLTSPLAGQPWAASPLERMTALCRARGAGLSVVTNGENWAVVNAPADGLSSVGTWLARIWQQEPVTLQAFVSLMGVRRCFGGADATFDSLLIRSQSHQNEVTDTLGEQVRRAIEVLVQALDQADLAQDRKLLAGIEPPELYEAGLTVMMRLVVLLCAEQRNLLLLGDETYDQFYAVTTLRARLFKEQRDLTEEVLERRHDAWSRLLAVFRGVYGGIEHDTMRLPPLGGSLFNPDRFPFLEGRAPGTAWRTTPANPLPIDNRTVLMLLSALQVLEQKGGARMLSYEALDVEQIGHVYEGLLERTVKRVPEVTLGLIGSAKSPSPVATLSELEAEAARGEEKLVALLQERTGRSEKGLLSALKRPSDDAAQHRIVIASGGDQKLAASIGRFGELLREDPWGRLLVYQKDSFIVTLGTGRRETGTHYTPKSLTEPIVQHTLEPLVYFGPAEGHPQDQWRLKSPAEILSLKICDMAMGSAAFLVQTCRWLGDRLVEAWEIAEREGKAVSIEGVVMDTAGSAELLAQDKAERVLTARRLVASRCLYGVDFNRMAVDLAKVSLWLVTMQRNKPFSFLDHALKSGDSLLGVSSVQQIEKFSLRSGERQVTFATANLFRYVDEASAKRRALEDLPSNDHTQIETKNRLHAQAEAATAKVKAIADCLIALELRGFEGNAYEEQRTDEAEKVQLLMKRDTDARIETSNPQSELARAAREALRGRRLFHWAVEFPEVFARGGFNAFVGNPPFAHGKRISSTHGDDYTFFLRECLVGRAGSADLVVYFFRRAFDLLNQDSYFGLIGTNTVAQADSREVGLHEILAQGGRIYRAIPDLAWPGAASVIVSLVWVSRGNWAGDILIGENKVAEISSFLTAGVIAQEPNELNRNLAIAHIGSIPLGTGFYLTPREAESLIRGNSSAQEVIYPFVGGRELYETPTHKAQRFIIDFGERTEVEAARFENCFQRVFEMVKPQRDKVKRRAYRERWWRFAERQKNLYEAIDMLSYCFTKPRTSSTYAFILVDAKARFDSSVVVFAKDSFAFFAVVQSGIHEAWAWHRSPTLKGDLIYSPTDCFRNFPFPEGYEQSELKNSGRKLYDSRSSLCIAHGLGLTPLYNRFHDRSEQSVDIARLRALHVEMDNAVAAAYGWSDLDLGHGFHATKQGERYTISEPARRTVLDRLLALNHQRYEEEVKAGLHEKGAKKGKAKTKKPHPEQAELL